MKDMERTYTVAWDIYGNRAVVECVEGYPIRGIVLPAESKNTLPDDIAALESGTPPQGGMMMGTGMCLSIVESPRSIVVRKGEIECGRELTDEEKGYLTAR